MKKIIIIFVGLFFATVSFSQNSYQDSLISLLDNVSKREKIGVLNKLSQSYQNSDTILCLKFANEALALAKRKNYAEGEAEAYLQLAKHYFRAEDRNFKFFSDSTSKYYAMCVTLSNQIGYNKGLANSYFYYGAVAWRTNNLPETVENYLKAIEYAQKTDNKNLISVAHNNIADVYYQNEQYSQAVDYYLKSIEFAQNEYSEGVAYLGMGMAQFKASFLVEAEKSLLLSLQKIHDKSNPKNYDDVFLLYVYQALAELYLKSEKYNEAEKFIHKAEKFNIRFASSETIFMEAELNLQKNNYDSAMFYAQKYLLKAKKDMQIWRVHIEKIAKAYKLLSEIEAEKKAYKSAYQYFSLHKQYSDSTLSFLQSQKIIEVAEMKEAMQKKMEIEEAYLKKTTAKLRQKLLFFVALALLFIALFLVQILFIRTKLHSKDKKLLTNKLKIQELELKEKENQKKIEKDLKEISELKLKNAQTQIESQERELVANATHILHINQKLEDVIKEARKIQPYLNTEGKKKLVKIIKNFKIENENESWIDFKNKFDLLHSDFYNTLTQNCPELSSTEKKICALLTVDLSISEIASILGKTYNTTNVAISRIRQKFKSSNTEILRSSLKQINNY